MGAPNNKDWEAVDDHSVPTRHPTFRVTGKVETHGSQLRPVLEPRPLQGINPQFLLLDLTIVDNGEMGTADVALRETEYAADISDGQYTNVTIMWKGLPMASIEIKIIH